MPDYITAWPSCTLTAPPPDGRLTALLVFVAVYVVLALIDFANAYMNPEADDADA